MTAPRRRAVPSHPAALAPSRPRTRTTRSPTPTPAERIARARRLIAAHPRPTRRDLAERLRDAVHAVHEQPLLDRLIRGRGWIPVLGVMLAGIVFMQVEVLKLDAGVGRSVQASTRLSAQNALLRASVASLADDQRIESVAAGMGMVMPAPTAVGFLSTSGAAVHDALSGIRVPDPAQFLTASSQNGGVAGLATSTPATSGATGTLGVTAGPTVALSTAAAPASAAAAPASAAAAPASAAAAPASPAAAPATSATAAPATSAAAATAATGATNTLAPATTTAAPVAATPASTAAP